MSMQEDRQRPAIMETITESELKELEFQASESDKKEFYEIALNYGWDASTVDDVWNWFELQNPGATEQPE